MPQRKRIEQVQMCEHLINARWLKATRREEPAVRHALKVIPAKRYKINWGK